MPSIAEILALNPTTVSPSDLSGPIISTMLGKRSAQKAKQYLDSLSPDCLSEALQGMQTLNDSEFEDQFRFMSNPPAYSPEYGQILIQPRNPRWPESKRRGMRAYAGRLLYAVSIIIHGDNPTQLSNRCSCCPFNVRNLPEPSTQALQTLPPFICSAYPLTDESGLVITQQPFALATRHFQSKAMPVPPLKNFHNRKDADKAMGKLVTSWGLPCSPVTPDADMIVVL